jgi:O-antigen/teichoic acid export membrane protein
MTLKKSLKERVMHSLSWSVTGTFSGQLLRLASNLLLTRLLLPQDFGAMAVVQVIMTGLVLMTDVGMTQTLVYHPRGAEPHFRNAVWTLGIFRGLMVWVVSLITGLGLHVAAQQGYFAPDSVYADPRLPWLVVVTCLQAVFQSTCSTKMILAQRELQLKQITLLQLYSQVVSIMVMLAWAWMWRDVWALVAGGLVSVGVQVTLSHVYLKGQPDKLVFDKEIAKELFRVGRWVFLSSAIGFLASGGDRLLLGGLENKETVGVYAIAFLLLSPLPAIFNMVAGTIVFPALSEVQRDHPERLPEVYVRLQRLTDLGLCTLAGVLSNLGTVVVPLMYDHRYHEAGWMFNILALGLMALRFSSIEQIYKARGQTHLVTVANVSRFALLFGLVPLAHAWGGLHWALAAIALAGAGGAPVAMWYRHTNRLPALRADAWALPALAAGWLLGFGVQTAIHAIRGI